MQRLRRVALCLPGRHARRGAAAAEHRQAGGLQPLQALQQRRIGHQQPGAAVAQDVLHLVGLEVPVHRAPQRAQVAHGPHQRQRVGAVAHHQRHHVAFLDAGRAQRGSAAAPMVLETLGGDGLALEDDGGSHAQSSLMFRSLMSLA
jgi:hypothetical protein